MLDKENNEQCIYKETTNLLKVTTQQDEQLYFEVKLASSTYNNVAKRQLNTCFRNRPGGVLNQLITKDIR